MIRRRPLVVMVTNKTPQSYHVTSWDGTPSSDTINQQFHSVLQTQYVRKFVYHGVVTFN